MKCRLLRKTGPAFLAIWIVVFCSTSPAQKSHPPHWSYQGKDGPEHWGQLDPAYTLCAVGRAQSPININYAEVSELPPLKFNYKSVPLDVINNGHTIQVNYPPGSTLTVGRKVYMLRQFHFHHPSEEYIKGRGFDLTTHLVHDDGSGHLAVVAILFKIGSWNALFSTVWMNVPARSEKATNGPSARVNATSLLPPDRGYYTFQGSLTTPPCSEGVVWYVLKNQATLSADQVALFAKLYPNNARPTQPLYGREVLETK